MSPFYLKNMLVSTVCLSAAYFVKAALDFQHKLAYCTLREHTRPGLLRKAGSGGAAVPLVLLSVRKAVKSGFQESMELSQPLMATEIARVTTELQLTACRLPTVHNAHVPGPLLTAFQSDMQLVAVLGQDLFFSLHCGEVQAQQF